MGKVPAIILCYIRSGVPAMSWEVKVVTLLLESASAKLVLVVCPVINVLMDGLTSPQEDVMPVTVTVWAAKESIAVNQDYAPARYKINEFLILLDYLNALCTRLALEA